MSVQEIIVQLLLGGLLGVTGQSIRVVIGLKKQSSEAQSAGTTLNATFDSSRLRISLLIGFVAGILAMLALTDFDNAINNATGSLKEMILGVIAAGYAGTDFIEGFMTKYPPTAQRAHSANGNGDAGRPTVDGNGNLAA